MAVSLFTPNAPPDWFLDISPGSLYGLPLIKGVDWTGLYTLIGITAAGFAVALFAMRRREVGR
ncbi:MAG TPA: hypothetical protein VGU71_10260 [Candidatus Dormibacteraeota bacterium]|nr:hypothetical protein [Candidatus Dormibacteraeota bacterium]